MSMVMCAHCDRPIDTDDCPETWREEYQDWLCDGCYDDEAEEREIVNA